MYTVRQIFDGRERSADCATAAEAVNLASRWESEGPKVIIVSPNGIAGNFESVRDLVLTGRAS